ncbi:hypothetical protein [Halobacillus seohaensis]|uniref:Uncharacterized protein n=1 Tax=Halobacillus seohaensis TaxID=447421 RepID=A0ABW2EEP7_9BACI
MSFTYSVNISTLTKSYTPLVPPEQRTEAERKRMSQIITEDFNLHYKHRLADRGLRRVDFDLEIKGNKLVIHKMVFEKDNGDQEIYRDVHKVPLEGNKDSSKLFSKVGATLMAIIPLEARKTLAATTNEFQNDFLGDYKFLTIGSLFYTSFSVIFNFGMLWSVIGLTLLFLLDYAACKLPKPPEIKEQQLEGNTYNSFFQRSHMFLYILLGFVIFSVIQVIVSSLIQIYDPGSLEQFRTRFPWAAEYFGDGTLGIHTVALGYGIIYYIKRIKKQFIPDDKMIKQSKPQKTRE